MHYMLSTGPLAMATQSWGMEMGLERTRVSEEPSAEREPGSCQTHWGEMHTLTYPLLISLKLVSDIYFSEFVCIG